MWWQRACDDAMWIFNGFGEQAARDGWSEHDLFGILPWHHGWGGITCRLRGARNLKMDADRAVWAAGSHADRLARGFGATLISSGLVPIWEIPNA
jgi:hypothetical protein